VGRDSTIVLALVHIHGPGPVLIAPLIGEIWNSSKHPQYHTSYLTDTDELVSLLHDRNVLTLTRMRSYRQQNRVRYTLQYGSIKLVVMI
jgi:hypothetical protein